MSQTEWWKKAVCYQIYPRSFKDSNSDGIGDLNGIISKLDYLNDGTENSLGIDAIWLNPVYPSPQYDFGYDIMDIESVDPQYGTMEDFDRLIIEAHNRGIRILMDFVPSVTSHLHPWFIESRSSKSNPKRDWYIWKDAPVPGRYPNNWLGMFGGGAWTWLGCTIGQSTLDAISLARRCNGMLQLMPVFQTRNHGYLCIQITHRLM